MKRLDALFDLTGRVAVITGGNSGIGKAIAFALGAQGAKLVLMARRQTELDAVCAEFADHGIAAIGIPVDLADRTALEAACKAAAEPFGTPDILVNCSGINIRRPFPELTDDDWDATLAINLAAPFFMTRALAPAMKTKGWGRIINIASLQSVRAFNNSGPYGASKGGVMQLTRATAEYWSAFGVTCNAIAPGFFNTPLTAPVFADPTKAQRNADATMMGRNGELPDLYGSAIFLASNASAYVTGQTLFVDGGFSAK
ncbi:MAG: SDR family oxidoreductase [Betaproteobacteria bacterium]|nr:MAG: SDR family oxidoreductase [Betaproteobacteria bacterium]